ncbi:MAG: hypothetical protein RLZZ305_1131 [Actinomycetota bacterium]|jgi:hypothetical protein
MPSKQKSPDRDKSRRGVAGADTGAEHAAADEHVNVTFVIGSAQRDGSVTETEDGRVFTSFDLVVRGLGRRTVVPVTFESEVLVREGEKVAVIGTVEKRFYPSGGRLTSRTDVRAVRVTVVRRASQVERLREDALRRVSGA